MTYVEEFVDLLREMNPELTDAELDEKVALHYFEIWESVKRLSGIHRKQTQSYVDVAVRFHRESLEKKFGRKRFPEDKFLKIYHECNGKVPKIVEQTRYAREYVYRLIKKYKKSGKIPL